MAWREVATQQDVVVVVLSVVLVRNLRTYLLTYLPNPPDRLCANEGGHNTLERVCVSTARSRRGFFQRVFPHPPVLLPAFAPAVPVWG